MNKTNNIHDIFFKKIYLEDKYTLDLFKLIFTKEEFSLFNWQTLKSQRNEFVSSENHSKFSDCVFSVALKNAHESIQIILLIEHKSRIDPNSLVQLLEYQACLYSQKKTPIIPIIIYHGHQKNGVCPSIFKNILQVSPLLCTNILERISSILIVDC